METLKSNLIACLAKRGEDLSSFLAEWEVKRVKDLPLVALQDFCAEEAIELNNLLCYDLTVDKAKVKAIKLLILDVDGVMTNGGMYFTENGDQFKRYNTKDGMGIMALHKTGVLTGIISSGFKMEVVKARADLLKIDRVYVGREPKLQILEAWCKELNIQLSEVGMIGDDINDLGVMQKVGFSAAPADAVDVVKRTVDVVLRAKGGAGCVRELIDYYLLDQPLGA